MKLYLDTEFNGHGGDLISMALVSDYGHEWYRARNLYTEPDSWVRENVLSKLGIWEVSHSEFRNDFIKWIQDFDNPEVICDWHADAAHFCELFAGDTYQDSLDFPFRLTVLRTPPGQPVSSLPHNALADAKALRDWHQRLIGAEVLASV